MPAVTPPPASVGVSGAGSVADSVDAAPVVSVSLTLPAVVSVVEAEVSGLSPTGSAGRQSAAQQKSGQQRRNRTSEICSVFHGNILPFGCCNRGVCLSPVQLIEFPVVRPVDAGELVARDAEAPVALGSAGDVHARVRAEAEISCIGRTASPAVEASNVRMTARYASGQFSRFR